MEPSITISIEKTEQIISELRSCAIFLDGGAIVGNLYELVGYLSSRIDDAATIKK